MLVTTVGENGVIVVSKKPIKTVSFGFKLKLSSLWKELNML